MTKYETDDGRIFDSIVEAMTHEKRAEFIEQAKNIILPKKFDACGFSNGGGYVQLSQSTYEEFIKAYRKVIQIYHQNLLELFDKSPKGFIGRYLCDMDSPAYSLWTLCSSIDSNLRLWGQPYFGSNPGQGKQVKLAER